MSRMPEHLSVILELKGEERGSARLETLMDEVAEIAAWSACVGIPLLSIYEKTGKVALNASLNFSAVFLTGNRYTERIYTDYSSHRFV